MKEIVINNDFKIYNASMLDMLDFIEPNSIDAIVCDPPYGLTSITKRFGKENSTECKQGKDGSFARLTKGFMGKEWDGTGIEKEPSTWEKCLKVLKPGGYLLAFGGTRTYHRIAVAIEDAGFELRDTLMWLYGSGFPKSHNIGLDIDKKLGCPDRGHRIATASRYHPDGTLEPNGEDLPAYQGKTEEGKKWQGYGTLLKPAYEPIIMARKPTEGTNADNVIKYGVGAINIDECRIGNDTISVHNAPQGTFAGGEYNRGSDTSSYRDVVGRFPANLLLDETINEPFKRYFYCAKASKKDRDEGCECLDEKLFVQSGGGQNALNNGETEYLENGIGLNKVKVRKNNHPTVKPTELMQYLIRLVAPKGSTILDPFNGSGSTGKACAYENAERDAHYKYIGIELDEDYVEISKARIANALNKCIQIKLI